MRILLTGGTGFIAKDLIDMGLFRGHDILASTRSTDWNSDLGSFDCVIHLAGKAHDKDAQWRHFEESNIELTFKIINNLKKFSPMALLIFFSTSKVYGEESYDRPFNEADQLNYQSDYGKSKALCEKAIIESELRYIILRPTLVVGGSPKGNLGLVKKAADLGLPFPRNINNNRSLCSSKYIFRILGKIFENKIPENQIYNLSERTNSSVEIFREFGACRFINYPKFILHLIPDKLKRKIFGNFEIDGSKIARCLN
ncbi:MAG: hypothetical protein COV38_03190 [Bdellovibrionales bacterium CG11_big_fil_rev_8_21_14_0_20_38_13]|nr:MAG: hypothetical protein COW79_15695 [Bdellovibrionales bacterium CG22_combo_CG10-13_8_21_14_all_38_13]PIR30909.1 MAG: hypothetical protein COV38_03190 [Bdellovibrionales bacterium CG11_big_fil_rev_8_21_14_0_20_38_13]